MPSPKALILQGILGVAGLCASGAGGIGLGLGKAFGEVQSDAPAADIRDEPEINPQDTGEVDDVDVDLGIPEECEGSCSLSEEQLKKLKFEVKEGSSIAFEGLDDGDEFELIIEESEDQINYPKGNKYILKPKTIAGTVTIKNIKEGDIVLGKDQEVVIREVSAGGKLEHLLEEVDRLGIPKRCKADEVTGEAKTCELTKLQLQKLNLETRNNEKITVEGQNEGNIVTLTIEDKGSDKDNYPRGKKYTLRSNGYVTIGGAKGGDILLEKDKDVVIRETSEGGKLEYLLEEIDGLGIPRRCKADEVTANTPQKCELIQKQLKDLKFETKEGSQISVDGWNDNSKFELTIEDKPNDGDNYPQGKKYTLSAKTGTATIRGVKEGDIDIWDGQSVVIRETSEGGKLERAPVEVDELGIPKDCKDSCQLTPKQLKNLQFETKGNEGITVELLNKAKMVTLRVENRQDDRGNYPKGKKYILNSERGGQVKIKGLKDGDIIIGREGAVVIREKEEGGKLEKAPEEINNLGIPRRCNADEVSAETRKCQLTKEQLQRINFEAKSGSSIKFNDLSESSSFELTFKTIFDDTDNYPKLKKYTLKAKTGTVTIAGAKDKDIVLEENKTVVFREIKEGNKLETYLDILGIPRGCGAEEVKEGSDPKTCELTQDQLKELKFENFEGKNGDATVEGLRGTEKITLKISWDGDKNNYPDNRKYSLANTSKTQDIKIIKEGEEVKITKQTESWFGNKDEKLSLAETKNKGQIEIEDKLAEVKKILKQLGLEGLSSNLEFEAYGNNRTKLKQTSIEFKNESGLKKIQFKELGGGATGATRLGGFWGIKVYLDWDDDANKFPKNMKFLFESPSFDSGYNIWKGNNTVTIYKKDSKTNPGNKKNTFKIENLGDRWYLARTNG